MALPSAFFSIFPYYHVIMNANMVLVSVGMFVKLWGSGGQVLLTLRAIGGVATVALECSLGHPAGPFPLGGQPHPFSIPFSGPPPTSPPRTTASTTLAATNPPTLHSVPHTGLAATTGGVPHT